MTNAMIVLINQIRLMEEGKIGTTGRMFIFTDGEGNEKELPEPEPIHTFAYWKKLGYHVKAGETAVAKFGVWKHTTKKTVDEDMTETYEDKMIMKVAAFFSASQVEKTIDEPIRKVDPSEYVGVKRTIQTKGRRRK